MRVFEIFQSNLLLFFYFGRVFERGLCSSNQALILATTKQWDTFTVTESDSLTNLRHPQFLLFRNFAILYRGGMQRIKECFQLLISSIPTALKDDSLVCVVVFMKQVALKGRL